MCHKEIITNYHLLHTFGSTQFFLKDFYLTLLVRGNAWRCLQLFKRHDGELDIGGDGHGWLLLICGIARKEMSVLAVSVLKSCFLSVSPRFLPSGTRDLAACGPLKRMEWDDLNYGQVFSFIYLFIFKLTTLNFRLADLGVVRVGPQVHRARQGHQKPENIRKGKSNDWYI